MSGKPGMRGQALAVTFDREGYDPRADAYAVTCPSCHTQNWFIIRGGRWPVRCPVTTCRAHWHWSLGHKVEKRERVGIYRRQRVGRSARP